MSRALFLDRDGTLNEETADEQIDNLEKVRLMPGVVPALSNLPPGCAFAPRCALASDACRSAYPPYQQKRTGHWAACWHADTFLPGHPGAPPHG